VTQLRVLLPWVVHRARAAGVKCVAIYGAGMHTRLMLPMWRALDGPRVLSVVVTRAPSDPWCCGFPVVSMDEFDPASVDAIVLSSHGYEHAMGAACASRFPGLPAFSIWSPPAHVGNGYSIPSTHVSIPVSDAHAPIVHR
jgi:hypothetical protein